MKYKWLRFCLQSAPAQPATPQTDKEKVKAEPAKIDKELQPNADQKASVMRTFAFSVAATSTYGSQTQDRMHPLTHMLRSDYCLSFLGILDEILESALEVILGD